MELFEEVNKELGTNYNLNREIEWMGISRSEILSEYFIEKYQNYLNWRLISIYQKLSEQFIEKWKDKVNWYYISANQVLSEDFIEKYKDLVDWAGISYYQRLSKKFIEKHKDKINFSLLKENILVKSDIDRDWFIAYVNKEEFNYFIDNNIIKINFRYINAIDLESFEDLLKVKIFYKDLISTLEVNVNKVRVLREVFKYKIYGKFL